MLSIFATNKKHDYSCVMLKIPDSVGKKIKGWALKNIKSEDVYQEEGYGREWSSHITALYGLLTPNYKDVEKLVKTLGLIDIRMGNVNMFRPEDKPYDVIKVEVDSPKLVELHNLLSEKLENEDEHPEFKPHLTLAYIKKGKCRKLLGHLKFTGDLIKVDTLIFSSSLGKKTEIKL